MYRSLDPDRIVATLDQLQRRIDDRFKGAGLAKVCTELTSVARECRQRSERLATPNRGLRAGSYTVLAAGTLLFLYVLRIIDYKAGAENLFGVLQGIEAAINIIVLVGAAVLFLFTLETRWKRRQALADLHELRSIVHVIDMHQLTKDPSTIAHVSGRTPSSPARPLSPFELTRYLDYCSEMLSLTAKVAAVYAERAGDPVVIEAVSDIERLTASLSQKIWQKITILQSAASTREGISGDRPSRAPAAPGS